MQIGEVRRIDFSHSNRMKEIELWQALFDIYREHGCPLDNMHNIILDFLNCKNAVEDINDIDEKIFYLMFDEGEFYTTWRSYLERSVHSFCYDVTIEIILEDDKATLTRV